VIDFSNIDNFIIDGNADSDTVKLTGTTNNIGTTDTVFGHIDSFNNIEKLDISSLTLDSDNSDTEFEFTTSLVSSWTDTTNNLELILEDSAQADKIKFEDKDGKVWDGRDTDHTVSDGVTYNLSDDVSLTIDIV